MTASESLYKLDRDDGPEPHARADSLLLTATRILTNLCAAIDAQDHDIISTVLLMDPDGKRLWPAAGQRRGAAAYITTFV
jgi:hypothetical protein